MNQPINLRFRRFLSVHLAEKSILFFIDIPGGFVVLPFWMGSD